MMAGKGNHNNATCAYFKMSIFLKEKILFANY